jgi:hypothetical protein
MTPITTFHSGTCDALFSDEAAKALQVAAFAPGHRSLCDCLADKSIAESDCAGVHVYDSKGAEVAHFSGAGFHARADADGRIVVFRVPMGGTQDAGKLTLAGLNRWHLQFYRRGDL